MKLKLALVSLVVVVFLAVYAGDQGTQQASTSKTILNPVTATVRELKSVSSFHAEMAPALQQKVRVKRKRILELAKVILKTPAQRLEAEKLLSDELQLKAALQTLEKVGLKLEDQNELDRMDSVDTLTKIVQWKENPLLEQALLEVQKMLLNPIAQISSDHALQRSVIGDRLELFVLLQTQAPERAKEVLAQVKNTPENAYYRFSSSFYLKRQAD